MDLITLKSITRYTLRLPDLFDGDLDGTKTGRDYGRALVKPTTERMTCLGASEWLAAIEAQAITSLVVKTRPESTDQPVLKYMSDEKKTKKNNQDIFTLSSFAILIEKEFVNHGQGICWEISFAYGVF